jgi:hypothetical protein
MSRRRRPLLGLVSAALCWLGIVGVASPAGAQAVPDAIRVQLHVAGDAATRATVTSELTRRLEQDRSIELIERDGEFVLSVLVLPVSTGGYAVSIATMNVYTPTALQRMAREWGGDASLLEHLRAQFSGAGALVDQRVLTGPDLAALSDNIAAGFTIDILGPVRRARAPSR